MIVEKLYGKLKLQQQIYYNLEFVTELKFKGIKFARQFYKRKE